AKVVLALMRGRLPAQLHLRRPTGAVEWGGSGVEAVRGGRAWEAGAGGRLAAGVSSFGISGTNAHVIVEGAAQAQGGWAWGGWGAGGGGGGGARRGGGGGEGGGGGGPGGGGGGRGGAAGRGRGGGGRGAGRGR